MPSPASLDPARLSVVDVAALLSAGGVPTTPDEIQAEIADGLPANADGTLNLVLLVAWEARAYLHRDGK